MRHEKRQPRMSDEERIRQGQPEWAYDTPWGTCLVYRPKRYQANQHFARISKRETERLRKISEEAGKTLERLAEHAESMRRQRQAEEAQGAGELILTNKSQGTAGCSPITSSGTN